jgi:hypothetical protein
MGRACSMHRRDENYFGQKTRREDLGIDGRVILE